MKVFLGGMLTGVLLLLSVWAWRSYVYYEAAYRYDVNRLCRHWEIKNGHGRNRSEGRLNLNPEGARGTKPTWKF